MAPILKRVMPRDQRLILWAALWSLPPKNGSIEMHKIVLLRHGESVWNKENLFTGWTDFDLSERGRVKAKEASLLLKERGYSLDIAFTSC
jgi:hypothetical protein